MTDDWKAVDAVSTERKTYAVAVAQAAPKRKKETSNAKARG